MLNVLEDVFSLIEHCQICTYIEVSHVILYVSAICEHLLTFEKVTEIKKVMTKKKTKLKLS